MFAGLATFMPHSPRQLIRAGKVDLARLEFGKIIRGEGVEGADEVAREFDFVRGQIEFEMEREIASYGEIWRVFRGRVLVWVLILLLFSSSCLG